MGRTILNLTKKGLKNDSFLKNGFNVYLGTGEKIYFSTFESGTLVFSTLKEMKEFYRENYL